MIPVFDSNILIDCLNGYAQAQSEILRYNRPLASILTWAEVMVGAKDPDMRREAENIFAYFDIIDVTRDIAALAVEIRQQHRVALPDAVIWATAKSRGTLLVTRNARDFPASEPDIRIPYHL